MGRCSNNQDRLFIRLILSAEMIFVGFGDSSYTDFTIIFDSMPKVNQTSFLGK